MNEHILIYYFSRNIVLPTFQTPNSRGLAPAPLPGFVTVNRKHINVNTDASATRNELEAANDKSSYCSKENFNIRRESNTQLPTLEKLSHVVSNRSVFFPQSFPIFGT
jgi:hypothetical protein